MTKQEQIMNGQDLKRYIEGQNETTAKIPGIYRTHEGVGKQKQQLARQHSEDAYSNQNGAKSGNER